MAIEARRLALPFLVLGLTALPVARPSAQEFPPSQPFPSNGGFVVLAFTGAPEDYVIPTVNPPAQVRLAVKGGAGGDANPYDGNCISHGGRGARLVGTFLVGTGQGELAPGGTLRFIIGQAGHDDDDEHEYTCAGSGGGGSGVLYRAPGGSDWVPLLVAGAGGGAAQKKGFGCVGGEAGDDASLTECGTGGGGDYPGSGGCDGQAGTPGNLGNPAADSLIGGAGGGLYSGYDDENSGGAGLPAGGSGAYSLGWGCGGGGLGFGHCCDRGAGGGGGYSGGGGGSKSGSDQPKRGGGGGSFVAASALLVQAYLQDAPEDGQGFLAAVAAQTSEDCSTAEVIPVLANGGVWNGSGSTLLKLPSALAGCTLGTSADTWFRYANPSHCTVTLSITGVVLAPSHLIEAWSQCTGGTLLACAQFGAPSPPLQVIVPGDGDVWLRILPVVDGTEGSFSISVTATVPGPDSDGDGVLDCDDICPGTFDPGQLDTDHDGVGDVCDVCPGYDDTLDDDGDGVPNGCDICPGSDDVLDTDLDGVPDGCDVCMGDDSLDTDGDGLPDACDPTPYSPAAVDCDGNQLADDATDYESRYEAFEGVLGGGGPSPVFYTLNSNAAADPVVTGGVMRLAETGVGGQLASMVFEPVTQTPTDSIKVHFDVRMGPGTGLGADGLSFSLLDPAVHGPDALFNEDGARNASLDISFDTYQNAGEPGDNFVEVAYDGVVLGQASTSFDLEGESWLRVELIVSDSGLLWLSLFELAPTFVHEPLFVALPVPGWEAKAWRYGFGTRTGADTNQVLLDNILFQALDDVGDCNGDGVPDACEQTVTVLGPETALAGTGGVTPVLGGAGDLCSGNWTRVSLSQALPGSLAYIFVGGAQLSMPFMGGLLVPTPDLIEVAPTGPGGFEVVFPWFSGLPTGFSLWLQAWVIDPGAPFGASASNGLRLTTP